VGGFGVVGGGFGEGGDGGFDGVVQKGPEIDDFCQL
jgi:hypothetical protein